MKVILTLMSVLVSLGLSALSPAWAGGEESGGESQMVTTEQQLQNEMEELANMLRETMIMLRDLEGKPSAAAQKRLDAMIARLNILLAEQKEAMKRLAEEQKQFMQRQNETFTPPPHQEEIVQPR